AYGLSYLGLSHNPLLSLLSAILAGAAGGAPGGRLIAPRRGVYFSPLTIARGPGFLFVLVEWDSLSRGAGGLLKLSPAELALGPLHLSLKDNVALFYFVVAILALCLVFAWRLVHSPFGKALQAIRMNETRARFVGYDVWLTKWGVFTLSGAFAGLAGG